MGVVSIVDFGAKGDGVTDNRSEIQAALDYARANGHDVYVPKGVFVHGNTLTVDSVRLVGDGRQSVLKSKYFNQETIWLAGTAPKLENLVLQGLTSSRSAMDQANRVTVRDGTRDFVIAGCYIDGACGTGIKVNGAAGGHIVGTILANTRADGIHMIRGARDIVVENNTTLYTGDDGIAVVSYDDQPLVHHITIRNNKALYNKGGRGLAVLGGEDVLIENNLVIGGTAERAGIYLGIESEWHTWGAARVMVRNNRLEDAGSRVSGHGAITVYHSATNRTIEDVTFAGNEIVAPRLHGIVFMGSGSGRFHVYGNTMTGAVSGAKLVSSANSNAAVDTTAPPPAPEPEPEPPPPVDKTAARAALAALETELAAVDASLDEALGRAIDLATHLKAVQTQLARIETAAAAIRTARDQLAAWLESL